MSFTTGVSNSFVTFQPLTYVTDSGCVNAPTFCYPIRYNYDLMFQMNIPMPQTIPQNPASEMTFQSISNGVATTVTGVLVSEQTIDPQTLGLFVNFGVSNLVNKYNDGECFTLRITTTFNAKPDIYESNECFTKIVDTCFTARLIYANNEDAFGFTYPTSWTNSIRLPLYFKNPVINTEQEVYVRSDGTRQKLFARLSRQYLVITDVMNEKAHENLVVAMNHDTVQFQDVKPNDTIEVTFENEYNNQFPSMMLPVSQWPAEFTVYETPFDELNSNCR